MRQVENRKQQVISFYELGTCQ